MAKRKIRSEGTATARLHLFLGKSLIQSSNLTWKVSRIANAAKFDYPNARADICFEYGSGGGVSVAKGATLPVVNACTRVTLVDEDGRAGVATGSICNAEQGHGTPLMVFHYIYTACTGPGSYFESATCRISLVVDTGGLPREPDPNQNSSCNGVFADPQRSNTGPLIQFSDRTLKAWNCTNFPEVPGGNVVACLAHGRSHPSLPPDRQISPK